MPFDNFLEDDFNAFAEEINRPRTGIKLDQLGDNLRKAANTADRIIGVRRIIEEACKQNPRGLPW